MQNKIYDIHERIYKYVVDVINYTKKLPNTPQNQIVIKQLVAAVSSVGANDQEADGADSKKDFIAKYVIARKECKETVYWLRVSKDTNPENATNTQVKEFIEGGKEIGYIISTIIKNAKV